MENLAEKGQAEELPFCPGRPGKEGLSEVRERATRLLWWSLAPQENRDVLGAFEELQGHQVPGAKEAQEAAGARLRGLWLLLWCDGSHRKALSKGGSGSGWWVGNRPQGPEWEQQDQSGGLSLQHPSEPGCGWDCKEWRGDGKWLDSGCLKVKPAGFALD